MAAMAAVLHFNDGASSRCNVMSRASIGSGEWMDEGSARRDEARIYRANNKASDVKKHRRRKIRQSKLAARLWKVREVPVMLLEDLMEAIHCCLWIHLKIVMIYH